LTHWVEFLRCMELYFFLFIKNVLPPVEEAQNSSTFHWCTKRGRQKIATTVLCFSQIQEASKIGKLYNPKLCRGKNKPLPCQKNSMSYNNIQALAGAAVNKRLDTCLQQFHQPQKYCPRVCSWLIWWEGI
jgi:hypothetical protein